MLGTYAKISRTPARQAHRETVIFCIRWDGVVVRATVFNLSLFSVCHLSVKLSMNCLYLKFFQQLQGIHFFDFPGQQPPVLLSATLSRLFLTSSERVSLGVIKTVRLGNCLQAPMLIAIEVMKGSGLPFSSGIFVFPITVFSLIFTFAYSSQVFV